MPRLEKVGIGRSQSYIGTATTLTTTTTTRTVDNEMVEHSNGDNDRKSVVTQIISTHDGGTKRKTIKNAPSKSASFSLSRELSSTSTTSSNTFDARPALPSRSSDLKRVLSIPSQLSTPMPLRHSIQIPFSHHNSPTKAFASKNNTTFVSHHRNSTGLRTAEGQPKAPMSQSPQSASKRFVNSLSIKNAVHKPLWPASHGALSYTTAPALGNRSRSCSSPSVRFSAPTNVLRQSATAASPGTVSPSPMCARNSGSETTVTTTSQSSSQVCLSQSLRSRRRINFVADDLESVSNHSKSHRSNNNSHNNNNHHHSHTSQTNNYRDYFHSNSWTAKSAGGASTESNGTYYSRSDSFKLDKPSRRGGWTCRTFLGAAHWQMKRGQFLQALLLLAVTFVVWDSYNKAMSTTEELLMVKHEEDMMMLHLKRLEEQSINLHESITRLAEGGIVSPNMVNAPLEQAPESIKLGINQSPPQLEPKLLPAPGVDNDLMKVQIGQLQQMEDELDHEVQALQAKIQMTARTNIVAAFGDGPLQVTFSVDFADPKSPNRNSQFTVLLWYDTPHAAWTLMDQIRHGYWDGSIFSLDQSLALFATPSADAVTSTVSAAPKLDFVEQGERKHEMWTVGLTEAPFFDESGNLVATGLRLFINLQDNSKLYNHDVCIGKVVDGFDTVSTLTRAIRDHEIVKLQTAAAAHLVR